LALALLAQSPESFLAVDRLDATALEVAVPAVQRLVDGRHLFQPASASSPISLSARPLLAARDANALKRPKTHTWNAL